jgi:hypothetical protein
MTIDDLFALTPEELERRVQELLDATPFQEEPEWEKQVKALLIPTPGHERSYTEIRAELEALGFPVPGWVTLFAAGEQTDPEYWGPCRPLLND